VCGGIAMDTNGNVFIKLQIERNPNSGDLMLILNFDTNAPNFSMDRETIRWTPTLEELDLVLQTYGITAKKKSPVQMNNKEVQDTLPLQQSDRKIDASLSEELPEQKYNDCEPFEGDIGFEEQSSEADFESSENDVGDIEQDGEFQEVDVESSDKVIEKTDSEDKIFVQVDEKAIDEALKSKGVEVGEAFIVEESDKGLIDKVLKKRIKKENNTEET